MEMKWTALKDKKPEHGQAVLITDGVTLATAIADTRFYPDGRIRWDGCGFSGHEWDWDFCATHWMPQISPDL